MLHILGISLRRTQKAIFQSLRASFASLARTRAAREKIALLITCTSNCFNRLFSAWLKVVKNFYSAFLIPTLWMCSRFTSTSWSEMFAYIKMLVLRLLIVSFLHFPYGEENEDSPKNEARVSFEINRPKRSPCVIGTRWRTRRCRVSQRKVSIVESPWVFWTDSNLPSVQLVFHLQMALALAASKQRVVGQNVFKQPCTLSNAEQRNTCLDKTLAANLVGWCGPLYPHKRSGSDVL